MKLARTVFDKRDPQHMFSEMAQVALTTLVHGLLELEDELQKLDELLLEWHRQNEASRRLAAIPGSGVITATAIVATASDPGQFHSGATVRSLARARTRTRTQASTGNASTASPSRETAICGGCLSSVPRRLSTTTEARRRWRPSGCGTNPDLDDISDLPIVATIDRYCDSILRLVG